MEDENLNAVESAINKIFNLQQKIIGSLRKKAINTETINRVEIIDNKGRSYVNWNPKNKVDISIQDEGRTMKVFIKSESPSTLHVGKCPDCGGDVFGNTATGWDICSECGTTI